jgi:RNA polymerase sigma-70 factor, ECF subfamily
MERLAARADRESLERLTDAEVAARVLGGETALFELIMRRYNRRLFRIARGVLGGDAEAEDAVQEAYVSAYFKLAQFRGPDGFATWLYRIATNAALMRVRARARTALPTPDALQEHLERETTVDDERFPTADPAAALHEQQMSRLLERAIDALPDPYRAAFVMREVEQMSVADTAACLGIEAATVKTRVHRARGLLQRNLSHELASALTGAYAFDGPRCDSIVERVLERIEAAAHVPA